MSGARRCYIGLGSNLDQPRERIVEALQRISHIPGVSDLRCSPCYRSPPWGPIDQPEFVNAVAEVSSALPALDLLEALLSIERAMGRVRNERWGPRRIDLDLLHVDREQVIPGELAIGGEALVLPHPRIAQRAFVLRPWLDLVDDLDLPGQGRLSDLLAKVDCSTLVRI